MERIIDSLAVREWMDRVVGFGKAEAVAGAEGRERGGGGTPLPHHGLSTAMGASSPSFFDCPSLSLP